MNIHHGFMSVVGISPKIYLANPLKNAIEIINYIGKYVEKHPGVIVFPELCLTGYSCGDLFTTQSLQNDIKKALQNILNYVRNIDSIHSCLYVIGAPLYIENGLYNVAIVLSKQGILGIIPKKYLANDNEFYEKRWFLDASKIISQKIYLPEFQEEPIAFGTNFIFQSAYNTDFILGVEICRDLWAMDSPSHDLVKAGATVIVNLSASNDVVGKRDYRRDLVRMQSAKQRSVYMYVNTSCSESTTDTMYTGHSLIAENGKILTEGHSFFNENIVIADVDLQLIKHERMRYCQQENQNNSVHIVYYRNDIENVPHVSLLRNIDRYPFLDKNKEKQNKICREIFDIQVGALRRRLLTVKPYIISLGISGGLDSSLVLFVLDAALKSIDKQEYNPTIKLFYLEGYGSTNDSLYRSLELTKHLNCELNFISIKESVLEMLKTIKHDPFNISLSKITSSLILQNYIEKLLKENSEMKDFVFENIQARIRTNILMNAGFMLGTSDLSELALGYSTYGGDHASMYNVNCGIPKTLITQILIYLRDFYTYCEDTINDIIDAPISAELVPNQTTENSLGNYEIFDFIMYNFLRHGFSKEKILYIAKHANWFTKNEEKERIFMKHLDVFFQRFYSQQYKRSFFPDGPKVLDISLSPRTDWRMPSDLII